MTATRNEIEIWLRELYDPGSGWHTEADKTYTHMIVACDTYDWENYPVYVEEGEDVRERVEEIRKGSMSRVDEVYSANYDLDEQMAERRAFNYD